MSISVIIPARNSLVDTQTSVRSVIDACDELRLACQLILIDDCSEESEALVPFFRSLRLSPPHRLVRVRTHTREHYTGVFTLGLCLAEEERIFFISNDMFVTASFMKTLLAVCALSDKIGIVRGVSAYTDSHPEHVLAPPMAITDGRQVREFSRAIAEMYGLQFVDDPVLSGDAILIRRSLVDRIGVLDTRFFGYFGDVDYGMRALLAGFRLVCAKGAWVHHKGGGHLRREAEAKGLDLAAVVQSERMRLVTQAFEAFRDKWGFTSPSQFPGHMRFDLAGIAQRGRDRIPLSQAPPANWRTSFSPLS